MNELYIELSKFLLAVPHAMELSREYKWKCPLCGGDVTGIRVEYNGHLHAGCNQCNTRIMQ